MRDLFMCFLAIEYLNSYYGIEICKHKQNDTKLENNRETNE